MAGNPPAECASGYCEPAAGRCAKDRICRWQWLRLWGLAQAMPGYNKDAWMAVDRDLQLAGALDYGAAQKPA